MDHHTLFSDKADIYERARPRYPIEIFSYLSSLCKKTDFAWDCACGNGQAAIDLVKYFDRVYASDVSQAQIDNAKEHPRINYCVTASEKTALANNSVDLICVAQALHWFDYEAFWPEVHRVLKRGGIFCALGYNLPSIDAQIDKLIQKTILAVIEPYWAPQNKLIWDHYNDITFGFKKIESPKFNMSIDWNLNEFFAFIHTFSATRRCIDSEGDAFFKYAYLEAAKLWGNKQTKKQVVFDFVFYVGLNE